MTKQLHFFGTKNDLIPGIDHIESATALHYILCSQLDTKRIIEYSSLKDIKNLGIASAGQKTLCSSYLVLPKNVDVKLQRVFLRRGGISYSIDQGRNPKSIVFEPGGIYHKQCLIAGSVGTVGESNSSIELFKMFSKSLTKKFDKIKSYYVGPEAMKMLQSGDRLITMGIDEPKEYDLAL